MSVAKLLGTMQKLNKKQKSDISDSMPILGQISASIKPKDEDENLFWKVIDVLNRGQYASANFAKDVIEGKFDRIPRDIMKGIQGYKKGSYIKLAKKYLPKDMPKWAKIGVGFIGDVALDPTTYIGTGLTKVGTKALKLGKLAKAGDIAGDIGKLATQAKLGQRVLFGIQNLKGEIILPLIKGQGAFSKIDKTVDFFGKTKLGTILRKAFSTSTGNVKLDKMLAGFLNKRVYKEGQSVKFGKFLVKSIDDVAKKSKTSYDEVSKNITELVQNPQSQELYSGSLKVADTISSYFDKILSKEQSLNIIGKLDDQKYRYFPRITTDEVKQFFKSINKDFDRGFKRSKRVSTKLQNALKSKTNDISIAEFNKIMREEGYKNMDQKIMQFFMEDPAQAATIRGIRSAKATTSAELLNNIGEVFGKTVTKGDGFAPRGWNQLPKSIQAKVPSTVNKFFDPVTLDAVQGYYEKVLNPKEVGEALKGFDSVQNWWKAWTLSIFPSYNIRNAAGNWWNNNLAGVNNTAYYKALALQVYGVTKNKTVLRLAGMNPGQARKLTTMAEKLGVIGTGWVGADIPKEIGKSLKSRKFNSIKDVANYVGSFASSSGPIITNSRKVAEGIENNARLAHFIDKVGKGFNPDEAAMAVKEFLFDYGDLTSTEKEIFKRLSPFYTWTRKNIPLQLENLVKQPQKFARIGKVKNVIEEEMGTAEVPIRFPSEFIKDSATIKLRNTRKGVDLFVLDNWLPATDIVRLAKPMDTMINMMSPFIKAPIENWLNYSTFLKRNIERFPREKGQFLGVDLAKRTEVSPTELKKIYDNFGGKEVLKNVIGIDGLRNFRLFNELDKLNPWDIFGVDRPHRTDPSKIQRWINLFVGKLANYDEAKAFRWYEFRKNSEVGKLKAALRKARSENSIEEANFLQQSINNIRKELNNVRGSIKNG